MTVPISFVASCTLANVQVTIFNDSKILGPKHKTP